MRGAGGRGRAGRGGAGEASEAGGGGGGGWRGEGPETKRIVCGCANELRVSAMILPA